MSAYTDDAYKILGVSPTATEREIKVAYRKLALEYHPDRQRDDAQRDIATHKFVAIANAYEVLTDPYLRAEYNERRQCCEPTTTTATTSTTASTTTTPNNNNNNNNNNNRNTSSRAGDAAQKNAKPTNFFGKNKKQNTASAPPDIAPEPFRYHFSDPYEVFKRDFRDQFGGVEYPGAKYDWIDFNEPIVAPATTTTAAATTTNPKLLTNGPDETSTKKKGFNLFRRNKKDASDPAKNDRQLVAVNKDNGKDLPLSTNACTDIVLVNQRNNRPISMDVQTSKEGPITITRTTITRPDGSTETMTMRTGIPGKAPTKPQNGPPVPRLTNGNTPKLLTNSSNSTTSTNTNTAKPGKSSSPSLLSSSSNSPNKQQLVSRAATTAAVAKTTPSSVPSKTPTTLKMRTAGQ
jgi:DnaJ domain